MTVLARISVGVIVERQKAASAWIDFLWRPVAVLPGEPEARPWTILSSDGNATRFYAGSAEMELHRSETAHYLSNLTSGAPSIWVTLRRSDGEMPYRLFAVTADPTEGESFAEAGDDIVEALPMPEPIRDLLAAFVAEHHVEREFVKRQRDRADPERMARQAVRREEDGGT
ncbi:MAG TPA: DUF3305 domain-containing protein [Xanthobacteraceae bacterium]|nr:DUF3305 domain-containing protein [Xanthobacteraceae bacterium]